MSTRYEDFVASKLSRPAPDGLGPIGEPWPRLFPFQCDLTRWALRRGRAAIFADTGLGKTGMELTWAREVATQTSGDVLVLTPLAVAPQVVAEGILLGVSVSVADKDPAPGVHVLNYDRLHRIDPSSYAGVVLDESSCLKHQDSSTFARLCEAFRDTPYRLAATATPAPNDWTELGTHAEFLGVCTRAEMLSEFFCHDGGETQDWKLKGHARGAFWRWVASWAALIKRPSDLGYEDDRYALPPLEVVERVVAGSAVSDGALFVTVAETLQERRAARKASIPARVAACVADVNAEPNEPWVIWCDLNAEGDALAAAMPDAVEVRGSDDPDTKEESLAGFASGNHRILISKPSICGWGLNWQHAARMAFVGVTDSWEAYYQAVRRCWRFGQRRPVRVHVYASEAEGAVTANLRRKEEEARALGAALSAETRESVMASVRGAGPVHLDYSPSIPMEVPAWL